jgi:hypothetical protein
MKMNNLSHLKDWLALSDEEKLETFESVSIAKKLSTVAIEKDWWVTHTLAIIFSMTYADKLIFKGGTSLSKAWNLIERFSEDVDLVLDRGFLGFAGELSKSQIRKLRYASYEFLTEKFTPELDAKFKEYGFTDVTVKYQNVVNHDQDPLIVEIYYPKLTESEIYLRPGVLVEIGSRSLKEPFTPRNIQSIVSQTFADSSFTDKPVSIPTVNPERTFLEKVFLLHEEFQRPAEKIRVERLSRHLYDIEKLAQTPYFDKALQNKELYGTIVAHRYKFSHLQGVDYARHNPSTIRIIPPEHLLPLWEKDYYEMIENMIYGEKLPFDKLIQQISAIQQKINSIKWE